MPEKSPHSGAHTEAQAQIEYSILYLFNANYSEVPAACREGLLPSHRMFGFLELEKIGHKVRLCPPPKFTPPKFASGLWNRDIVWRFRQAFFAWREHKNFDCIVATQEANALPVLLLKRLCLLKTPIIVINIALLQPKNLEAKRFWFWRWLLPAAEEIVSYCSFQIPWIEAQFGLKNERLSFIPLGIDSEFFAPNSENPTGNLPETPFCLSVGVNYGKDYPTLLAALPDGVPLVIATDYVNAQLIEKLRAPQQKIEVLTRVPIRQLRDLYRRATLMIIPLHDMRVSLGQTVLLENMVLGKLVVVSDTSSVRDYITPNFDALTVPPADTAALRQTIEDVFAAPETFAHIGENAARSARENFTSQLFAARLLQKIEKHVARRSTDL